MGHVDASTHAEARIHWRPSTDRDATQRRGAPQFRGGRCRAGPRTTPGLRAREPLDPAKKTQLGRWPRARRRAPPRPPSRPPCSAGRARRVAEPSRMSAPRRCPGVRKTRNSCRAALRHIAPPCRTLGLTLHYVVLSILSYRITDMTCWLAGCLAGWLTLSCVLFAT